MKKTVSIHKRAVKKDKSRKGGVFPELARLWFKGEENSFLRLPQKWLKKNLREITLMVIGRQARVENVIAKESS